MQRNGTSPVADFILFLRVFSFLLREREDIVFSFTIKNNIYAGLACRVLGVAFVPNVTGLGPAFNNVGIVNRIVCTLYRLAFVRAKVVFFQNSRIQRVFVDANLVHRDRCRLLPGSGVDLAKFGFAPMPPDDGGLVFLLIARLLWDKGVGLFAEAARQLRRDHPGLRFQVLGPTDPHSRTGIPIEQIAAWVNAGDIEYLGYAPDVRPAMKAAHCIVLPSWYREGTPRVLLEAAAVGRPAISTDMPGCRDAIVDGQSGMVCAAQDLDALAQSMARFASLSRQERMEMGQSARMVAEARFDETLVIKSYLEQVKSVRRRR